MVLKKQKTQLAVCCWDPGVSYLPVDLPCGMYWGLCRPLTLSHSKSREPGGQPLCISLALSGSPG